MPSPLALKVGGRLKRVTRLNWRASWDHGRHNGVHPLFASAFRAHARLSSGLTHSISKGPDDLPLIPHTIPENFAKIVSQHGDRPAVITREAAVHSGSGPPPKETTLTYAALDAEPSTLAHALRGLGVKKGDRVAVSLGNIVEHATLTYALFKLGAVLVPLNPAFNASQLGAALSHLGVETLIMGAVTDRAYKPGHGQSNLQLLQSLVPDLGARGIESAQVPTLKQIVVLDNTEYHPSVDFRLAQYPSLTLYSSLTGGSSPSRAGAVIPDAPLDPHDTINIQFTSGTTSHPKAAMLTHTNVLNNGYLVGNRMGLTTSDRIVCPPPLFHCFGCILGYMATVTHGAAILFPSPAFDPIASLKMALDHRATGLHGVATMFGSMLDLLDKPGSTAEFTPAQVEQLPTHLRKGIAAGSPVPEALVRTLSARLGLGELVICYGMTETSPVSCMTAPADPPDKRTATVDRAMPHTRVKIVDPADRTKTLPIGARGELAASGYLVMQGYWGNEAHTAEVRILEPDDEDDDNDGGGGGGGDRRRWWLYSGDEAAMTTDAYVAITGRLKDLIVRGGENIRPREIKDALLQHPRVAAAAVVGVPDARLGEAVCAVVVPRAGGGGGAPRLRGGDVRAWVRGRLGAQLVPRHVFWTDDLPKTASGKIQKFKLREAAAAALGATSTGQGDE